MTPETYTLLDLIIRGSMYALAAGACLGVLVTLPHLRGSVRRARRTAGALVSSCLGGLVVIARIADADPTAISVVSALFALSFVLLVLAVIDDGAA